MSCKLISLYKQKPNKTRVFKEQKLLFEKWRSAICELSVIIVFSKWKHLDLPINTLYIVIMITKTSKANMSASNSNILNHSIVNKCYLV